jgi:hypothetical protein
MPHVNRLSRRVRGRHDRRHRAPVIRWQFWPTSFSRLKAGPRRGLRPALIDDIGGFPVRRDRDRPGPHSDHDRLSRRVGSRGDRRHRARVDIGDVDGLPVRRDHDRVGMVPDLDRWPRCVGGGRDRHHGARMADNHDVGGLPVRRDRDRSGPPARSGSPADLNRLSCRVGSRGDRRHRTSATAGHVHGPRQPSQGSPCHRATAADHVSFPTRHLLKGSLIRCRLCSPPGQASQGSFAVADAMAQAPPWTVPPFQRRR